MLKIILFIILLVNIIYASSYSKQNIVGVYEVSSLKLNGFTSFGKEFSKNRGEIYTLIFNRTGEVKNQTTSAIYNYEVTNGELKIYQTKTYKDNYKRRSRRCNIKSRWTV